MPRTLRTGQRSQLFVLDVESGESTLVHESDSLLFEAPNWTPDGRWLIINGDGHLFRIPANANPDTQPAEPERIDLAGVPEINNDHVLSPDGSTVYVSAEDGHLYAVPLGSPAQPDTSWGGTHRRVSNDHGQHPTFGSAFRYYLHGVSPDGGTLAYIGLAIDGDSVTTNVFTIPTEGGPDTQLTNDTYPDDGCEYSPDGQWIYFNSERAGDIAGHAQLFRIPADPALAADASPEQLTHDDRVNWFPHISPDGMQMAYLSYPAGTQGHPADLEVILRLLPPSGDGDGSSAPRDLVHLFGGQGTINVPSWDPTSSKLAYVAYPLD